MSLEAITWAWDQTGIGPSEKLVLLALADAANQDGLCWPSQRDIASRCCLTRQAVNGILQNLESAGLIQIARDGHDVCTYRLVGAE